jgi:hypothetical protein
MGASGSMNGGGGKGQQMPAMGQQGGGSPNYSTAFGQNAQQYGLQPQGMNAGKAGAAPPAWANIARRQGDPNAGYGGGFDQSNLKQPTPYEFQQGKGGEWGNGGGWGDPPAGSPGWQQNGVNQQAISKEGMLKPPAGGPQGQQQEIMRTMEYTPADQAADAARRGQQQTTGWGQSTRPGGKGGMPPQGQQGGGAPNYSTAFGQAAQQGGLQGGGGKGGQPPAPGPATPNILGNRLSMFNPQSGAISYGMGGQNPNAMNPLGSLGGGGNPNPFAQGGDAWAGGSQMAIPPMSGVAGQQVANQLMGGGQQGQAAAGPGGQQNDASIAANFDQLWKEDPTGAKARAYADMNVPWYQRNQMQVKEKYFGNDANKRNLWTNTYSGGGYQNGVAMRNRAELAKRFK